MSTQTLNFYFNIHDPTFTSKTVVIQDSPNYISHAFVKSDIYDSSTNQRIGYKATDDYVQQVEDNKYIVRLNNVYYFDTDGINGSISWVYSFENTTPNIYYPVGIPVVTNIISTTGSYYGKTGSVTLVPLPDGARNVTITFA